MSEPTEFIIGSEVSCSDGACGELRRVVIDPVARALTHLVVEPKHGSPRGHLVPLDLVLSASDGITLTCTTSEFEKLDEAEEAQFIPGGSTRFGYGQDQMLSWPYYGLGGGLAVGGLGGVAFAGTTSYGAPGGHVVTNAVVPEGEVLVRRGEHVNATDGAIGKVKGLVIRPGDHCVTHVLLDEGHLWGQKMVAIPISAVKDVEDGVRLNLTKDEVRDLPPVQVDEHE
ncbi:MAG: PRC-barrel domain-containing protein [Acidimicrobiales bacterium]|jgi:sporulation protein YlmC with PRC-barrel domain